MAFNGNVQVSAGAWIQLTANDATVLTVQFQTPTFGLVKATVGATTPTSFDGALRVEPYDAVSITLAEAFPGIAGVNRLYAFCADGASVSVSHD